MSDPVMPVIIALPPEIDLTNASGVPELITAACAPGVAVVIADLTGTSFCDSAGLRHLIRAGHQAAGAGAELRLAIAPDGAVSRVVVLTGINRHLAVYPTLQLAIDGTGSPADIKPGPAGPGSGMGTPGGPFGRWRRLGVGRQVPGRRVRGSPACPPARHVCCSLPPSGRSSSGLPP